MIRIDKLSVSYGNLRALCNVSLVIENNSITTLIGANGAGKSTLLRAVSGLIPYSGDIFLNNRAIKGIEPHCIVGLGIVHVPEGRGIFGNLTVMENLLLATWQRKDKGAVKRDMDMTLTYFPRLAERLRQSGGTLSGGEQQMLALARGLMSGADTLMLDEPSMGLSPFFVREIVNILLRINREGKTILLIEQNANLALAIASTAYVLESGRITLSGRSSDLRDNDYVREAYLGI